MLITELIKQLEQLKAEHGDMPIFCHNRYNETVDYYQIKAIYVDDYDPEDFFYVADDNIRGKVVILHDDV